jgi:hypothetical protein
MLERGRSFHEMVNDMLRKAATTSDGLAWSTPVVAMGQPAVPLDQALRLAADLEDAELRQNWTR